MPSLIHEGFQMIATGCCGVSEMRSVRMSRIVAKWGIATHPAARTPFPLPDLPLSARMHAFS